MNRILILATAAKGGGARSILNNYLILNADSSDRYYVLSPDKPNVESANIIWIKKQTSGFYTYIFTVFLSYFYFIKFKCHKLLSFSNVNTVFNAPKVTYFHQSLIFTEKTLKFKLLRLTIKHLNHKVGKFVVQTTGVKRDFEESFGSGYEVEVKWPGVTFPKEKKDFILNLMYRREYSKLILFPASNIKNPNKQFELLLKYQGVLRKNKCCVLVTDCSDSVYEDIFFIGNVSSECMTSLYKQIDFTLVLSKTETVCLPIFESISFNKPALVLEQSYVHCLFEMFPKIENLYSFKSENSFDTCIKRTFSESSKKEQFLAASFDF